MFTTEHIECKNCKEITSKKLYLLNKVLYNLDLKILSENIPFIGTEAEPLNKNIAMKRQLESEIDEIQNNKKIFNCDQHN